MNKSRRILAFAATLSLATLVHSNAHAQSTAFTYQGFLDDAGSPANGLHDFRFRLFSVASGGTPIGSTLCADNVNVIEGVFTAQIDFGQQFATTAQRHLEIEVRRDTGLTCANVSGFAVLAPRQQLTSTPMASHANSAFSLDAADGSPASAVFVDNSGNVGIGTSSPASLLHLRGTVPAMILQDTASPSDQAGYVSFRNLSAETGWVGFGNTGSPDFGVVNARTGGDVSLFTWPGGGDILLLPGTGGDVGVGTSTPAAKLDVRGDIRLGSNGQFLAMSGEENLRIIRGRVNTDGVKIGGSGFTSAKTATGRYTVTFTEAFPEIPTVTATTVWGINLSDIIAMEQITTTTVIFAVTNPVVEGSVDTGFHFTAIGPR